MLAEREKDSVDSVTDAKAQLIRAIELEHNITVFEHLCIVHLIHCTRMIESSDGFFALRITSVGGFGASAGITANSL
jgi:hypothetical protein